MKKSLPENAKIAKEAKECVQECVSEFISFITSEGNLFSDMICLYKTRNKLLLNIYSQRQVSARKAQNDQRRGYLVGHAILRIRKLRRSSKDLSC